MMANYPWQTDTLIAGPFFLSACLWLRREKERARGEGRRVSTWPGVCLAGTERYRPSLLHAEHLQINSLQQQPLPSPAATRSASTRNQAANSFRSESWGGGRSRGVFSRGVWCCDCGVIDRYVWIPMRVWFKPYSPLLPPSLSLGSDNKRVLSKSVKKHAKMTERRYSEMTGLFIWLNTQYELHNIDPIHVWTKAKTSLLVAFLLLLLLYKLKLTDTLLLICDEHKEKYQQSFSHSLFRFSRWVIAHLISPVYSDRR